jgi:chromosomal replication initiation ATPase DnaA
MVEAVAVAIITGGLSLLGTIITVLATSRKTEEAFHVSQAVMKTELENLTREVREHNGFAKRVPVVEEQIKMINKRLANLEGQNDD